MLANIYRKLNERRIKLQRFVIDKHTFSAIQRTNTQLSHCRYVSTVFKLTGKESYSLSIPFKNSLRHTTNLAIEDKESFVKINLVSSQQIQITDEEVEKLLNLDWTSISSVEFVSNFQKLSLYINKLDERPDIDYENLIQAISTLTPDFHDEEIAHVLRYVSMWFGNPKKPKNVIEQILKILDSECLNRFPKMDMENKFMFCKLFCNVRYGTNSHFACKVLLKTNRKSKSLTPPQLVKFVHLLSICSNLPVNFYEIEYNLEKHMDSLSVHDVRKVLGGFLKNKSPIRSEQFFLRILELMSKNIDIITTQEVSTFAKFIQYSYKFSVEADDLLRKILRDLEPKVQELSLRCLANVSYLAAHVLIYEEKLMTSILERFDKEIQNAKLKDIEKITFSITVFNYDSSYPLYQKILKELCSPHREEEIEKHRRSLSFTLKYLALVNVYPINLLEKIMDAEFINKAYKSRFAMNDEYYFLDRSIAAEVPNYAGPRLSDNLRNFLAKKYKALLTPETRLINLSNTTKEVIHTCERLLNTKSGIYIDKLLPQFHYQDIVICLDEKNNPISPEPFLSAMQPGAIKPVPEEARNYKWLVLIIARGNMLIKDSDNFSGILASKFRQLQNLGYTPAVVSHYKWYKLKNNEDYEKLREDYIKSLLNIE